MSSGSASPGLTANDLERGKCYRSTSPVWHLAHGIIWIESIGPRWVRYRDWVATTLRSPQSWDHDFSNWRNPYEWSRVKQHWRVLFDSWDGTWFEVDDPSE